MRTQISLCLATAAALFVAVAPMMAASSDDESALRAKRTVSELVARKYSGERKDIYMLNAVHAGELEEALRSIRVQARLVPEMPAYIYRIVEDGVFVIPEKERGPNDLPLVWSGSSDGRREWIVAVSRESGEAFGLFGFDEAEKGFNALLHSTAISICVTDPCDGSLAEDLALLYYRSVMDPDANRLVQNQLELKQRVERYAYSRFAEDIASRATSIWWRRFSAADLGSRLGVRSQTSSQGVAVQLSFFQATQERDAMMRILRLRVLPYGGCEMLGDEIAFSHRLPK